ncbi:MAG: hypothetical protein K9G63_16145 [Melioribacteraceae bacterium]|nr:hypothetical protein [Melioribacteraceae bacterium]
MRGYKELDKSGRKMIGHTSRTYVEERDVETAANTIISLVHQAIYLLDQ